MVYGTGIAFPLLPVDWMGLQRVAAIKSRTGTPARRELPDEQECPSYNMRADGTGEEPNAGSRPQPKTSTDGKAGARMSSEVSDDS